MFGMLEAQSPRADFNLAILKTMVLRVMQLKWSTKFSLYFWPVIVSKHGKNVWNDP